MSLTSGRGPLSAQPFGRFSSPLPNGVSYVEPLRRRVRAMVAGRTVIDSERVLLVHRQGEAPAYLFPTDDAGAFGDGPDPVAAGYVRIRWDAVDDWYEEEERVQLHPRNPYHRIDVVSTSRRLRVEVAGEVLVDTTDTVGLWETSLDPRLYVARSHLRLELLERSPTTTYCPYKGTASYWSALVAGERINDVAWSYDEPLPESSRIRGLLSFDASRLRVVQELPGEG